MFIMSRRYDEEIYHVPQQISCKEMVPLTSPGSNIGPDVAPYPSEFLPEEYFQPELVSDLKYSPEKIQAQQGQIGQMSPYEFSPGVAGPSGVTEVPGVSSLRVPYSMSDPEAVEVSVPQMKPSEPVVTSYNAFYGKQSETPSFARPDQGLNPNTYGYMNEDFNSIYDPSRGVGEMSTASSLLSETPSFLTSLKVESGGDTNQSTSISTESQIPFTSAPNIVVSSSSSTNGGSLVEKVGCSTRRTHSDEFPSCKTSIRRRGRRRGYRRGRYAMYLSGRTACGAAYERDDLELYEPRNIQEESKHAYVVITEQPRPKALRFRYICEGRSAGSIPGMQSSPTRKTFPTIRVVGSKGPALAVVSCVTVTPPYRPHPHNLVGKDGCDEGVCSAIIDNQMMDCSFSNLGIQCVKKRDIEASLSKREEKGIDPYRTGFEHRLQPQTIDLNSIRLCFQVYLIDRRTGDRFPLEPVVSDPIYDKKTTSDLVIYKLSACSCCVVGGKEIILLCDKIVKDDIKVRFFEAREGRPDWEAFGDFQAADVHKQVAVSFKTPPYRDLEVKQAVKVWIQLFRPSDKSSSEPIPFEYYPIIKDYEYFEDKILHITPCPKQEAVGDSPAESMQEISDEGDPPEGAASGGKTKLLGRHSRSSPVLSSKSHRKSCKPQQEPYPTKRHSRLVASKDSRDLPPQSSFVVSNVPDRESSATSFDQSYCPQLEHLQKTQLEKEPPQRCSERVLQNYELTSSIASGIMSPSMMPMGPTATLAASSSGELPTPESEVESTGLQYYDMDYSPPSPAEWYGRGVEGVQQPPPSPHHLSADLERGAREGSLSPNSETIKRLKHDIETLNKLSNL